MDTPSPLLRIWERVKNWLRTSPFAHILPWLFPFIIQFTVMDGGIAVEIFRHGGRLPHWRARMVRRALPEPLVRWIDMLRPYRALQPYPLVKQLWLDLVPYASARLIIDDDPFASWQEVRPPKDFCLVWRFNRVADVVAGVFEGVDHALGMGWFQHGKRVWSIAGEPDAEIAPYLEHRLVAPDQASALLATIIPRLRHHLAVRADFRYITDFMMQIVPREVGFGKVTLALVTNHPELATITQPTTGYGHLLFADGAIIQYPRATLTPFVVRLLQERSVTLTHEAVPDFIEDALEGLERLHLIRDSASTTIRQANPLVLISVMQPTRTLQRTLERGIGGFQSAASYRYQQKPLDMDALIAAGQQHRRFVQHRDIWFAWPKQDIQGAIAAIQMRRQTFALKPAEVMGLDTIRLTAWNVQPPSLDMRCEGTTLAERGLSLFKHALAHGVPCGFVGQNRGSYSLFTDACMMLLKADQQAMILWLTSSGKKASATRALQADPLLVQRVTVASLKTLRDTPSFLTLPWTLLIIQDLDQLLDSGPEAAAIAQLQRKLAFVSVTQPPAFGAPLMRALCLPEQAYVQFKKGFLLDLDHAAVARPSAAAQATSRPAPARMAPIPAAPPAAKPSPTPISLVKPLVSPPLANTPIPIKSEPLMAATRRPSFWEQARRWEKRVEPPADWIPFQSYYPTYTDMSPEQMRWYFYWRSEVRKGKYPATDLSYIFVHVYEALACIGFESPQAAYERLVAVWERYRLDFLNANRESRLDVYLVPWIADFVALHPAKLQMRPLDWYGHALKAPHCITDVKLLAQAWLEKSGNWLTIPLAVVYGLADSHAITNYYQKHEQATKIGDMYRFALAAIDASIPRNGVSAGLIDYYGHMNKHSLARQPYQGALTEQSHAAVHIAKVDAAFNNPAFALALLDILKYVGSLVRAPQRKPALAYGGTIDSTWRRVIDEALANQSSLPTVPRIAPATVEQPPTSARQSQHMPLPARTPAQPRTGLSLDPAAIAQRQRESERLRELMSEPAVTPLPTPLPATKVQSTSPIAMPPSVSKPAEQKIAKPVAPMAPHPITPPKMPALHLDDEAIQTLSQESEQLRERLTVEEDTPPATPVPRAVPAPSPAPPPGISQRSAMQNETAADSTIDPVWQAIARQWRAEYWDMLMLITEGQTALLATVAQRIGKPLSQIIDAINLPVMEQLDDLLIDPDAHTITDYFTDVAASLVRWHLARK
jgi:hypothetical protein